MSDNEMSGQPGSWTYFGEKELFSNQWLRLVEADVQNPRGERDGYHFACLPRIAIALIVDEHDRALMLWRHRFPAMSWGYELLGGAVDEGESSLEAAAREAREESGWEPRGEAEHLISFEPLPGSVTAWTDIYLWRDAEKVGDPVESDEVGRLEWVSLSRIPELAAKNQLLGGGTLVPLLYYLATNASFPR